MRVGLGAAAGAAHLTWAEAESPYPYLWVALPGMVQHVCLAGWLSLLHSMGLFFLAPVCVCSCLLSPAPPLSLTSLTCFLSSFPSPPSPSSLLSPFSCPLPMSLSPPCSLIPLSPVNLSSFLTPLFFTYNQFSPSNPEATWKLARNSTLSGRSEPPPHPNSHPLLPHPPTLTAGSQLCPAALGLKWNTRAGPAQDEYLMPGPPSIWASAPWACESFPHPPGP